MPQAQLMTEEQQEAFKQEARNKRERIIDIQQWCAQYPELKELRVALSHTRTELEHLM